jgi:hypothetical protein
MDQLEISGYSVTPPAPQNRLLDRHFETTWTVFLPPQIFASCFVFTTITRQRHEIISNYDTMQTSAFHFQELNVEILTALNFSWRTNTCIVHCSVFAVQQNMPFMIQLFFQSFIIFWLAAVLSFLRFSQCGLLCKEFTPSHTPVYFCTSYPLKVKSSRELKMMSLRLFRTQLSVFKTTLDNSKLECYVS